MLQVAIIITVLSLLVVILIVCGILSLFKKKPLPEEGGGKPGYSVAVSNRLFKERRKRKKILVD